jgi:hypothetical protein
MEAHETDIGHLASSPFWVHWHSRAPWLRSLRSTLQLEVSCKIHHLAANHLSDNTLRSIPLGRMPFANTNTSRGILVYRLDLCRRTNSSYRIGCFCCRSTTRGPYQSQQSRLCGPAMARHVVLLVHTRICARTERLGLTYSAACEYCGGRLARSGFCCGHHYPGSDDRREAHRSIRLYRGLQYQWVAVRWDIMVGGTLVDRLPVPWVSIPPKFFLLLMIAITDQEQIRRGCTYGRGA